MNPDRWPIAVTQTKENSRSKNTNGKRTPFGTAHGISLYQRINKLIVSGSVAATRHLAPERHVR
jgi:hypothetical protein